MANNLEIKRFLNQCSILLSKQDIDNCIDNPEIANRAKLQNETEEMYIQKNIQYVNIKKFVMLNIYRQIKAAEMLKFVSNKLYKEALENIEKMKDFLIKNKYIKKGEEYTFQFAELDEEQRYKLTILSSKELIEGKEIKEDNRFEETTESIESMVDAIYLNDIKELYFKNKELGQEIAGGVVWNSVLEEGKYSVQEMGNLLSDLDKLNQLTNECDGRIINKNMVEMIKEHIKYVDYERFILAICGRTKQEIEYYKNKGDKEKQKKTETLFRKRLQTAIKTIPISKNAKIRLSNITIDEVPITYSIKDIQKEIEQFDKEGHFHEEKEILEGKLNIEEVGDFYKFLTKDQILCTIKAKNENLIFLLQKNAISNRELRKIIEQIKFDQEMLIAIYQSSDLSVNELLENINQREEIDVEVFKQNLRKSILEKQKCSVEELDISQNPGIEEILSTEEIRNILKTSIKDYKNIKTKHETTPFGQAISIEGIADEGLEELNKIEKAKRNIEYLKSKNLLREKDIYNLYIQENISLEKLEEALGIEELKKICKIENIANLYKSIYEETSEEKINTDKRKEYEKNIQLYNKLGERKTEELIENLAENFSDELLTNLYKDNLLTIEEAKDYGNENTLIQILEKGLLKPEDYFYILQQDVAQNQNEMLQYAFENRYLSNKQIFELYLQNHTDLNTLKDINTQIKDEENLAQIINIDELLELYNKSKTQSKGKEKQSFERYKLAYVGITKPNMQDEERKKEQEHIMQLYGEQEKVIEELYINDLISLDIILEYGKTDIVDNLLEKGLLRPNDAKKILKGKETGTEKIEKILKNPNLKDIDKIILIYSTYDKPEEREERDKLIQFVKVFSNELNSNKTGKKEAKENKEKRDKKHSVTDPFERWNLFSKIDPNYSKEYVDGFIIAKFHNLNKTIIEKMYEKRRGQIIPAYGVATFIMDLDNYETNIKNQILKEIKNDTRLDLGELGNLRKDETQQIKKITHHPARKAQNEAKTRSWGNRVVDSLGIKEYKETIYSKQDLQEIQNAIEAIENSRVEISR